MVHLHALPVQNRPSSCYLTRLPLMAGTQPCMDYSDSGLVTHWEGYRQFVSRDRPSAPSGPSDKGTFPPPVATTQERMHYRTVHCHGFTCAPVNVYRLCVVGGVSPVERDVVDMVSFLADSEHKK